MDILSSHKSKTRFVGGFSKGLVYSADSGHAAGVCGEESGHAARPIVDFKLGTIWLVGTGLGAVVTVMGS